MNRSINREQFVRTVGTFVLFGPPAGTATMWLVLLAAHGWGDLPDTGLAMLSLFVGYVVGVGPALITGALSHLFTRSIHSDAVWILACAAIGAVSGGLLAAALTEDWEAVATALTGDLGPMAGLALAGCMAAAVCALKLRQRRWGRN